MFVITFTGCVPENKSGITLNHLEETETSGTPTPGFSSRPRYQPGELVDYIVQPGDSVSALAIHFNTKEREIRQANPEIPLSSTTLPTGFPMKIPIYYKPLWGNPYRIIPDSYFINGPAQIGFSARDFASTQPGWFKNYQDNAGGEIQVGGELIDHIAQNFSISPRLLLAVVEYQTQGLSGPSMPDFQSNPYPLGYKDHQHVGLYQQLLWAANILNNGYYGWRSGRLVEFDRLDKTLERPDPWQNAATVALHYYFSKVLPREDYELAISDQGFSLTYQKLFGDPWQSDTPHIPGSLVQPELIFPFQPGKIWAFTGGPHTGWGDGEPFAAIDFAPPSLASGCAPSVEWVTAMADGIVVRSEDAIVSIDMDKDGDEHTGWVLFYLHLSGIITPVGTRVSTGDAIGHPSCEGGKATGTHIHIARKYNGEWVLADGALSFNLEGWVAHNGDVIYDGTLTKNSGLIQSNVTSNATSQIKSERPVPTQTP